MKALIDRSAEAGVESVCIGMPHRGAACRMRPHLCGRAPTFTSPGITRSQSGCVVAVHRWGHAKGTRV